MLGGDIGNLLVVPQDTAFDNQLKYSCPLTTRMERRGRLQGGRILQLHKVLITQMPFLCSLKNKQTNNPPKQTTTKQQQRNTTQEKPPQQQKKNTTKKRA